MREEITHDPATDSNMTPPDLSNEDGNDVVKGPNKPVVYIDTACPASLESCENLSIDKPSDRNAEVKSRDTDVIPVIEVSPDGRTSSLDDSEIEIPTSLSISTLRQTKYGVRIFKGII